MTASGGSLALFVSTLTGALHYSKARGKAQLCACTFMFRRLFSGHCLGILLSGADSCITTTVFIASILPEVSNETPPIIQVLSVRSVVILRYIYRGAIRNDEETDLPDIRSELYAACPSGGLLMILGHALERIAQAHY